MTLETTAERYSNIFRFSNVYVCTPSPFLKQLRDSVRPYQRKAYGFYIGKASNFGLIWNSIKTGPSICRAFWNASYKSAGVSARKARQPYASAMATALSPGRFRAATQQVSIFTSQHRQSRIQSTHDNSAYPRKSQTPSESHTLHSWAPR
jgi:hypothetical protein